MTLFVPSMNYANTALTQALRHSIATKHDGSRDVRRFPEVAPALLKILSGSSDIGGGLKTSRAINARRFIPILAVGLFNFVVQYLKTPQSSGNDSTGSNWK